MSQRKIGVLRFPGTNCDADVLEFARELGYKAEYLWHADRFSHQNWEALIVPGGFSYGDHLRCGALAAKSPAMQSLAEGVKNGVPVLGICNGFQILCEARLLPGALLKNQSGRFVDKVVGLKLQNSAERFYRNMPVEMKLPIAHGEGRYFVEDDELKRLQDQSQIWLTYSENPNGSVADIAGVLSPSRKVAGLMPHPERALHDWMGGTDGRSFL